MLLAVNFGRHRVDLAGWLDLAAVDQIWPEAAIFDLVVASQIRLAATRYGQPW